MSRFLLGTIVGIFLLAAYQKVNTVLDQDLCPDRNTPTVNWEGHMSTRNGITYCFERASSWPNKTIYRGIVKVD
jgi:hypothetical protein